MDKIEWSKEERELFQNALRELKKQVDECLTRDIKIRFDKISSKGTTSQNIKNLLDFLNGSYTYSIGIGNVGGFLNPDSWIAFVRKDIVRAGFINTEKFSVRNGVCLSIAYQGYFDSNPHFVLKFGFPNDGGIEVARCKAVNAMEQSGALERYSYVYPADSLDYERIISDFLEAMNYFNTFSPNDFIAINPQISGNDISQPQAQQIESISLNQILYGPPGTGKTYGTIDKALEILFAWKEIDSIPQERDEKKKKFDEFVKQGQIGFVIFHQSYGYEDFVEGIKPRLSGENDESQTSQKVEYEIRDGIFKSMCKEASKNYENSQKTKEQIKQDMELDDLIKAYVDYVREQCDKEKYISLKDEHIKTDKNIIDVQSYKTGNFSFIVAIEFDTKKDTKKYYLTKDKIKSNYEKFKNNEIKSWENIIGIDDKYTKKLYFSLLKRLKEFENKKHENFTESNTENIDNRLKPYILIIDEINRGNISKILGELITLLEPSKRKGENEALEVTLPYSQEPFSVPNNLYIIGTMNTADRSIALLDTALRRRFEFIEMMPNPSELEKISCDDGEIDLKELLKAMNNRIEFLLDRERTIGHSFFFEKAVNKGNDSYGLTLTDLKAVFKNKILPLLQEYFYDDYAKINAVLNSNGMLESKTMSDMEISLSDEFVDSEKKIWTITDSSGWDIKTFQTIYKNTESS